jgi:ribulose-phosphate 3-epimerase
MPTICPTVTAKTVAEYRTQIEHIESFAQRIHLDFMDGQFAPTRSLSLDEAWLPDAKIIDMHIMYKSPHQAMEAITRLRPSLVIAHAEVEGNYLIFARELHALGIKCGIALLQDTPVNVIKPAIDEIDHVLIFSGDLGHFGGKVDLSLLHKVTELRRLKPSIEIGWDGGINDTNIAQLVAGGIDVLNVGGFIQNAPSPKDAYATLNSVINVQK